MRIRQRFTSRAECDDCSIITSERRLAQSRRRTTSECVMLMQDVRRALADAVMARARSLHPYDNPALVVLPINGVPA